MRNVRYLRSEIDFIIIIIIPICYKTLYTYILLNNTYILLHVITYLNITTYYDIPECNNESYISVYYYLHKYDTVLPY